MQKLYIKSELWFAILWIILYVLGTSAADGVSDAAGMPKSITLVFHIALCIIAAGWMKQNGLLEKYGLCRPYASASGFLYYIPLLILISCNLWFGVVMNMSPAETALYVGSMICVGFLEEIIFRGFLFKAMCRDSVKAAIIVSSLTFGIGHLVNLINGSGADLVSNLCQVCYAAAIGFLFVILFYRGGSLWPCIITHSAVNALSAFSNEAAQTTEIEIVTATVLTIVPVVYALVLIKTLPKALMKVEEQGTAELDYNNKDVV